MNSVIVLSEPDRLGCRIGSSNTIGPTIRSRGCVFINKCVGTRIEHANFIGCQFCKPEMPKLIESQIERAGTGRRYSPLMPVAACVIFANRVGNWLRKPEIARTIESKEKRTAIVLVERLNQLSEGLSAIVKTRYRVFDNASWSSMAAYRKIDIDIALGFSHKDMAVIIKFDIPGICSIRRIDGWHLRLEKRRVGIRG